MTWIDNSSYILIEKWKERHGYWFFMRWTEYSIGESYIEMD